MLSKLFGPLWARALFSQPELRVALGGSASILAALVMTLYCPLVLLALSPLVLGVPHLLADVRYLVAQPGYHRRLRLALPVGAALGLSACGVGIKAGLTAVLLTLLLADGAARPRRVLLRRMVGVVVLGGLFLFGALRDFYWLELGLAHLHNFVAVLLLYLWRPRGGTLRLWPLALFVLGGVCLGTGALSSRPEALLGWTGYGGLDAEGERALLAPLLPLVWGTRLMLLFAFAQAVHYSIWLRLIPEAARERPAPRPFRASLRALHRDLGGVLLTLALLTGVGLSLWAAVDLSAARTGYFRLALFHGYLELCALGLIWIEGWPVDRLKKSAA
jgi:hypothetical protein